MSMYRQVFWKLLELGLIPDSLLRSKIRNGLTDLIRELNHDGNVETRQNKLNEFIGEKSAIKMWLISLLNIKCNNAMLMLSNACDKQSWY